MPISGSQKALMHAQFGVMRFGASRFGYHSPRVAVSVGGVQRAYAKPTASHKIEGLTIQETNSETPNKASFQAVGWTPTTGMEVVVTLGSTNRLRRLFGGTVLTVNETNIGDIAVHQVECVDWSWALDEIPVYGHYTGSASDIAIQLMDEYAPTGFTTNQVETGLPTLTNGITFTGVKLTTALKRLAKRAGVRQFIDYRKDLYFRATKAAHWTNPTNIVVGLDTFKRFRISRDLSQVANKVPFIGGGANTLSEVAIGETILPLTDAPDWWYGDVGGVVISGPQRITYTARVAGGGGSLVGPGASPSSAPTLALAGGSGVTNGLHDVTVVFVTPSGRSLPSPVASITTGNVSAPMAAATAGTPSSGGSMNAGTHRYYPVFRTAAGSTTAGPVSNAATAIAEIPAPASFSGGPRTKASGALDLNATYKHVFTFWDGGARETTPSPVDTVFLSGTDNAVAIQISTLATPPTGFERRFYRSEGGGTLLKLLPYGQAAGQFSENDGFSLIDTVSDGALGVTAPSVNTTATGACAVTGIPVSAEPLVTHVDMYREFNSAGASTAKLAFSVTNGTTSGNDTLANASLGATVPSTNTAAAGQISATDIAIGPSGTTDRELYMSAAGGGARKRALAIANNTATTGTIVMSDATLAGEMAEPTVDTSGLDQPSGQVLPGATSILVAGTAPFRSAGGWAFTGTQVIRYTGFSGSSLTGIPASGIGSIQQALTYNTVIAAAPCLIGIPSSGAGSIIYAITKGEPVNLYVTVEDTDAQAGLQSLLSAAAPVVRELIPPLKDERVNREQAIARATAYLSLRAYPGVRVGPYLSKDVNNRVNLDVNITITAPAVVNDTFQIQSVTISNFTPNIMPDYQVTGSDELLSIEELLARDP